MKALGEEKIMKSVLRELGLALIIAMLLNASYAYAYYPYSNSFYQLQEEKKANLRDTFTCDVGQLSTEDSFRILELLKKGFLGTQFDSNGKAAEGDRLENPIVIIPLDKKSGKAQKVKLADRKFDIKNAIHLSDNWINGPYAFGMVLTDTLRIGRCLNLKDKNIPCPLSEKQLSLRNSGTGIKSDFKPMWEFLKNLIPSLKDKDVEDLTDEDYRRIREQLGLPKSAEEDIKVRLAFSDLNDANIETYVRIPGKIIPNSILTYTFYAYGQTTCNSTDCVISIYSLFDKYYNQWFSLDMTFSTAMPVLLGKARQVFQHLGLSQVFPWRFSESTIAAKMRMKLYGNPKSLFGRWLRARLKYRATRYPEVGKLRALLSEPRGWNSGYDLLNPGLRDTLVKEWLAPDGWLRKIDDPIVKRELYKYVRDLDVYVKTQADIIKSAEQRYRAIRELYGFGSPQELAARIETGKVVSNVMMDYSDSQVIPNLPGWFSRNAPTGLWTFNVKQKGTVSPTWLAGDSTHIYNILDKFRKDGHFGGPWIYETAGNNLKLWRLSPEGRFIREISVEDLEKNWYRYKEYFVKLESGNVLPVADWSLPQIKKHATGPIPLYAEAKTLAAELTPEDFASKLLEERNLLNLKTFAPLNTDYMKHTLAKQGFVKRRYWNLLDRAISYQDEFFHNYMRPKGGIKWTAYFNLYWLGKRGLNQKWASAYMLPDTWREVRWPLGSSELYNDAFIDFFSHAGSDQGDMFNRMLQVMPWEFLVKNVFANFKPLREIYEKLKNNQIRNEVENLAFYATTPENCDTCGISIRAGRDYSYFFSTFYSGRKLDAYILEDPVSEKAKKKGTTIITYTHHTDIEGKEQGVPGTTRISLEEAIRKKKTCRDIVEKVTLGTYPKWWNPSAIGGALAFGENLGYVLFGFAGVFGSLFQQLVIAPKLQDCVDVDGGYYTHIFVPTREEIKEGKTANQLSAEAALNSIESFTKAFTSMLRSDSNSYTSQAAEEFNSMVEQFVRGAREDDIVQANVHMEGSTAGTLEGEAMFSFWFKGETTPMKYKTSGHKIIRSADKNTALLIDFKTGSIFLIDQNGNVLEKITDNNISSRLISTNTNIPAEEIPKRYTLIGLPDSNEPLFEMNLDSELFVLVPEVARCILDGIEYQIGVPYENASVNRLNLAPVFGKVLSINTDMYTIKAFKELKRIVAEGVPRRMIEGEEAKVIVYANRKTTLSDHTEKEAGLLESIIFENGAIIYKPDTHELVVWLKRSADVDLPQEFVGGIKLKPEEIINPETMCPEPAVSFEVLPSMQGGYEAYKVEKFNRALQKVGPFTVLETPTKRFIFFSRYEPDGKCVGIECCKDYIRIIDKETGEIYEAPIESFEVTPDGIHIKDAKGKEHNIGITAEDGRPMVVYNNYPPEPLVSAQGPNGSFWYDPEKGMWHAENAQLLPLLEAFRKGVLTQPGPAGQIITKPGDNIMNIQTGVGAGPFNLPSLPTEPYLLVLYIAGLVSCFLIIQLKMGKRKKENKRLSFFFNRCKSRFKKP